MKFKIYVDADGVITNFDKKAEEIGFNIDEIHNNKKVKSEFWRTVDKNFKKGIGFWLDMEMLNDAKKLWSFIEPYKPIVLTSSGKTIGGKQEKIEWFAKHFPNVDVIVVSSGLDKAYYADKNSILIDDTEKNIKAFKASGGFGILHKSANETIKELEEIFG